MSMNRNGTPIVTTPRASKAYSPQASRETETQDLEPLRTRGPVSSILHVLTTRYLIPHLPHLLVGMFLSALIVWCYTSLIFPTWDHVQDALHYGDARVSQLDADVGHGGMSHFLALYRNGQAIVIEFPDNENPTRTRIYSERIGQGTDPTRRVVTLSVQVMDGKRNLLIFVQDVTVPIVLYNTGTAFETTAA
jgi:hypothetical protein